MYPKRETEWQKQLIKDLAKEYGIDIRVVRSVVYYPFFFSKTKIMSEEDIRPIRHRNLGSILIKKRCEKLFNVTKEEQNS